MNILFLRYVHKQTGGRVDINILSSQMTSRTITPPSTIVLAFSHIGQMKYTFSDFNKALTLLT